MNIVRNNLMTREGYSPYCGNKDCRIMPRMNFNGKQFVCPCCKVVTQFPKEFIDGYRTKWNLSDNIDVSKLPIRYH